MATLVCTQPELFSIKAQQRLIPVNALTALQSHFRAPGQIADAPRAEHVVGSASERAGTEECAWSRKDWDVQCPAHRERLGVIALPRNR